VAFLDKAIKIQAKAIAIENKILHPNKGVGQAAYILKRDGRTNAFTVLAIFENFRTSFSKTRNRETFEVATARNAVFRGGDGEDRGMAKIAMIHTHIAIVEADASSIVYATNDGDQSQPYYFDWTWKFFGRQIGDTFTP
jgi:hypothetical protein